MQICQICGNEIDSRTLCCPFCGSNQNGGKQDQLRSQRKAFHQKTVNLEQGLPTVEQALKRLNQELQTARLEQITLLTLIHGYGSSGKGGTIRTECRKTLEFLKSRGEIKAIFFGEDFRQRLGPVKELLHRFPELSRHPHLNHNNKGITVILLS